MSLIAVPITNGSSTLVGTGAITSVGTAFGEEMLIGGAQLGTSNPVPVAGTIDVNGGTIDIQTPAVIYSAQSAILTQTTVAGSSVSITGTLALAHSLTIWNNGTSGTAWLNPAGGAAVVQQGAPAYAGGGSVTFAPPPVGPITAISDNGTLTLSAIGA